MENQRQHVELAEILSSHKDQFLATHTSLSMSQLKAYDAITACRTAAMGGHKSTCDHCGHVQQSYNSCRNRHCPKCQFLKKERWVDSVMTRMPVDRNFHVVFTIPACLHRLFMLNQASAYDLLFTAAGKALTQCAQNPDFLGAQPGAVAILHTWGQNLSYHPHIHMIVPAGGLSEDQMEWVPAHKSFFVPVKALSLVFRGILCRLLEQAVASGDMRMPDETPHFPLLKQQCYAKKWVVYCEKPFTSSIRLAKYLGNYTHRVAISNQRILDHKDNQVSFGYKDYRSAGIQRIMKLDAMEFIRRFMQHILPSGFYKIRYFGFLALCNMKTKLAACFALTDTEPPMPRFEGLPALDVWRSITGQDPLQCTKCKGGRMFPVTVKNTAEPHAPG
jgi:hypothetical protein